MIRLDRERLVPLLLQLTPVALFAAVVIGFGAVNPQFRGGGNLRDIFEQSAPVAIVSIGVTFVLLTSGIDLAVGSTMYLAAVVVGLYCRESSAGVACAAAALTGLAVGLVHAAIIAWLRVAPFLVTLSSMFIIRGLGKYLTATKAVFAPAAVADLERASLFGLPWALWMLGLTLILAWIALSQTSFGRQIYATGENLEAAAKAGINVRRILLGAYGICGLCAGLGGFVAFSQQGAAQNTFGAGIEFNAVAAAVLGGTSLFGGRGGVWGAVLGAVLVNTITAGLTFLNADPYIYPLVTASIIFVAVLIDSARSRLVERLTRRRIRVEP